MSELTVAKVMSKMPENFNSENAAGVDAVIQFHIEGEEAGDWIVVVKEGTCEVNEGVSDSPNLTMTADSHDYLDIVAGNLSGMQAVMKGKLQIGGDMGLAMKFASFFD